MGHLKLTKKTYSARARDIERKWYVVDAEGETLGRLSTSIANVLRGKHKVMYTPSMDLGDNVIVINARKVALSGSKETQKRYYRHSGYPGGLHSKTLEELREEMPEQIIIRSVRGMLPKNKLGRAMIGKLHVYADDKHPHEAQKPEVLEFGR